MAHNKAYTSTRMWSLSFFDTFNQFPNGFVTLDGGGILKVM
jgi:hypothetical protein